MNSTFLSTFINCTCAAWNGFWASTWPETLPVPAMVPAPIESGFTKTTRLKQIQVVTHSLCRIVLEFIDPPPVEIPRRGPQVPRLAAMTDGLSIKRNNGGLRYQVMVIGSPHSQTKRLQRLEKIQRSLPLFTSASSPALLPIPVRCRTEASRCRRSLQRSAAWVAGHPAQTLSIGLPGGHKLRAGCDCVSKIPSRTCVPCRH